MAVAAVAVATSATSATSVIFRRLRRFMSSSNTSVRPRVASVPPSASEILAFINGEHLLVGRSHEDNYPASITHSNHHWAEDLLHDGGRRRQAGLNALSSGQSLYTVDVEMKSLAPLDAILTQDLAPCARSICRRSSASQSSWVPSRHRVPQPRGPRRRARLDSDGGRRCGDA